ncbi:NACHT domain-containing protein [Chryseobacterium terrae]|uniref:NACHT domain-containing protein n=1 Tax=Chryseobacterium terrae TaxID=3163299 RepID=A0ABW8Y8H4_9FLAO
MDIISSGLALLNTLKEPLFKKAKEFGDEYVFTYQNGLVKYIDNYLEKFSKIKTFIHRDTRMPFYEVFYPASLVTPSDKAIKDIIELVEEKKYITISGNAGSGKSMLTKHIFISSVHHSKSVPMLIELRQFNTFNGTIEDLVTKIITNNNISPNQKITEKILNEGNFIFILDGYDEIFSENKEKITLDIENFVDRYSNNKYLITSRPGAGVESLQRFDNYLIQPLTSVQVKKFIKLQLGKHDRELQKKIQEEIENPHNKDFRHYLSNPLLLSMFIFTFKNYPELPKQKTKFYGNVFDTLCTRHDSFSKTGGWQHERQSGLKNHELEKILCWFSYISLFEGYYSFDLEYLKHTIKRIVDSKIDNKPDLDKVIYDLNVSLSMLIKDGTQLTFPHKSLQEYFAALLIKSLDYDQKKNVYTKKFKKFTSKSYGGDLNFHNLCFELDSVNFLNFVILENPSFAFNENIVNSLDKTKFIFKFLVYKLIFTSDTIENYEFELHAIQRKGNIFIDFLLENSSDNLDFAAITNSLVESHDFCDYLHEQSIKREHKGNNFLISEITFEDLENSSVLKFFADTSIISNITSFYDKIKNKLEFYRNYVSSEKEGTEDLLDV